ncbi:MAG TPA: glycine oxidase ThiO [Candidatus Acidoferrum sp.]|nr:glycine oxidase ThiO [Candidatus Acidoferrum sp.]
MKSFDVAIIGAGIIGASAAFELSAQKLRVVVLDRQQPGLEASWAAAGMLSPAPDTPRDTPLVSLGRESLKLYPDFLAAVEQESGCSTGYARQGAIEIFPAPHGEKERDGRVAECRRLGIAAEALPMETARNWESEIGPAAHGAAWLPEEGTVEPRLLMNAVVGAARNRGVEFRADCEVTGLVIDRDRCGGAIARDEKITADQVVVAAGSFSSQIGSGTASVARYAPTRPVRGQMMALRPDGVRLQRVVRSSRGYLVPRADGRIVAGSTSEEAGFEKRVTPGGMRRILDNTLELIPSLAGAEIVEMWSGLRPGTPDDLPILGPTDIEGLIIATGHYRNGILLAAVTSKLVGEWVTTGRTSLDTKTFSPLRFSDRQLKVRHAI